MSLRNAVKVLFSTLGDWNTAHKPLAL